MSVTGEAPTATRAPSSPRGEVWVRRALIVAYLLVAVGFGVVGARTSDLAGLERTLSDHDFHEVTVVGDGLSAGSQGSITQQVRWRDGLWNRIASVQVSTPGQNSGDDDVARITGHDVGDYLIQRHPSIDSLSIVRVADPKPTTEVLGWTVPQPLGVGMLAVQVLALAMLVGARRTWRATRWAWFWLWFTPFGVPAYLLLGGPGGPLGAPRPGRRRLTGGWAFLLMLALSHRA